MERIDCDNPNWRLYDCSPDRVNAIPFLILGSVGLVALMAAREVWLLSFVSLGFFAAAYFMLFQRGVLMDRKECNATEWCEFYRWRLFSRTHDLRAVDSIRVMLHSGSRSSYYDIGLSGASLSLHIGPFFGQLEAETAAVDLAEFLHIPYGPAQREELEAIIQTHRLKRSTPMSSE